MSDDNLNDVVLAVMMDKVSDSELFTALDISNQVKTFLPNSKHSEISAEVRNLYGGYLQSAGYVRTPIDVVLADGSTTSALLYHPADDAWDLDNKYDAQKRQQISVKPIRAPRTVSDVEKLMADIGDIPSALASSGAISPASYQAVRDQWDNLFRTQPSLFPRRD